MECFSVEFVSPDRKCDFADICTLTVRTEKGELVVMANHEKSVMSLLPGIVLLKGKDNGITVIHASRPVLIVEDNLCTVMADCFMLKGDDVGKLERLRTEIDTCIHEGNGVIAQLAKEDLKYIDMVLKS